MSFQRRGRQGDEMLQCFVMVFEHIIRQLDVLEDDKPPELRELHL